jgi:dihydrofolate reductase
LSFSSGRDTVVHMNISLIVAMDEGRMIGANGKIPWHLPADLKRFKEMTMGHPVIMGRKTFESLGRKPLPGRFNIVITRDPKYEAEGCRVAVSLHDALRLAENGAMGEAGDVFVIGGEQIYALALPHAQKLYLTKVHGTFDGDAHFPEFSESEWGLVRTEAHEKDENNPLSYDFLTYERNSSD